MTHNSGEILHLFGFFKVQRFEPKIVEFSYTYTLVYFMGLTDEKLEIYVTLIIINLYVRLGTKRKGKKEGRPSFLLLSYQFSRFTVCSVVRVQIKVVNSNKELIYNFV